MTPEENVDPAFRAAANSENVEELRVYLHAHAHPSAESLRLALFEQVWRDTRSAIVQALIAAGADLEARDDHDYMTPLMVAANSGAKVNVKLLIAAGANVNAEPARGMVYEGYKALHLACIRGYSELVQQLIEAGADVNAKTTDGSTPLMHAARGNFQHIAKMLLAAGANPSLNNDEGYTALGIARGNSTADDILRAVTGLKTFRVTVDGLARVWTGEHADAKDAAWEAALQAYAGKTPPPTFIVRVDGAGAFRVTVSSSDGGMITETERMTLHAYSVDAIDDAPSEPE